MEKFPDVRTLYPYTALNEEELSFESGIILEILDKSDEHWWQAKDGATGRTGSVPSNYIDEIISVGGRQEEEASSSAYADPAELIINNNNNNSSSRSSFHVWTKFAYASQRPDELSFPMNVLLEVVEVSQQFQGWWKAKNKAGEIGLIPSNYVNEIASPYISPTSKKPDVFPFDKRKLNNPTTTDQNGNNAAIVNGNTASKQHRAGLLVERKDPFPDNKAAEAKSSPGVRALTRQLTDKSKRQPPTSTSSSNNNSPVNHRSNGSTNKQTVSYDKELWYFGSLTRRDCENILAGRNVDIGDFLVRDSESTIGNFSLSLKTQDCIKHYKVINRGDKYVIGHRSFKSIHELVNYYSSKTPIYTAQNGQPLFLKRAVNKR